VKGRYSVYCFEDKNYLVDEFAIDWSTANFASLINLRIHDSRTE